MYATMLEQSGLLFVGDLADGTSNIQRHRRLLRGHLGFRVSLLIFDIKVAEDGMRKCRKLVFLLLAVLFRLNLIRVGQVLRPKRAILAHIFVE